MVSSRIISLPSQVGSPSLRFLTPTDVTVFDVSHNTISGVISPFIKQLVNVTYLDLSSNLIVGGIPSEVNRLFHPLIDLN